MCTMQNILGFVVFYTQRDTYSEYIDSRYILGLTNTCNTM